jgi:F-type H+-transporting ATPase subunit delta
MTENHEYETHHTADVSSQRVAQVYAEALLNAAGRQAQAAGVLEELDSLVGDLFRAEPQLETFLSSGAIGRDRKAQTIRTIFENRASATFANFLQVLNRHERLDLLRPTLAAAREIYNERSGNVRVDVRTAVPLPDDQRERLRQEIRNTFHREPQLEIQVDPELLGGLVVQIGDWLYDASVRSQLNSIRNQLIARSSHEIQTGRDRFSSANGN